MKRGGRRRSIWMWLSRRDGRGRDAHPEDAQRVSWPRTMRARDMHGFDAVLDTAAVWEGW